MHNPLNVKFVNAKQAKETYQYKDTKEKLHKTNAAIFPYIALQPLLGLGLPHKTPPFIPIFSSSPPSSYPQQL